MASVAGGAGQSDDDAVTKGAYNEFIGMLRRDLTLRTAHDIVSH
jgi:hypothetical protein